MRDITEVPSPCVRNCCLDAQDICLGCQRTLEEICVWSTASRDQKLLILERCRQRVIAKFTPPAS